MVQLKSGFRGRTDSCSTIIALCSIDELPDEVILYIVKLSLPPKHLFKPSSFFPCANTKDLSSNTLRKLTLICKRWYALITTCPSFWTTILEAYDTHKLDAVLETQFQRASDQPLSIAFFGPYASSSAWRHLLDKAHMVQEIYQGTTCIQDPKSIGRGMAKNFPRLKRLHVTYDGCQHALSFFRPDVSLPALDTLSLTCWPFKSTIPQTLWTQLRHLSLQHASGALTHEGFTVVAQNLVSLRLKNTFSAYLRTDPPMPPLEFPRLKTLELDMSDPVPGFSRLTCPVLKHLILAGTTPIDVSIGKEIVHDSITHLTLRDTLIVRSYTTLLRRLPNLRILEVINPLVRHPSNLTTTVSVDVETFLSELLVSPESSSRPTCPVLSEIRFLDQSQTSARKRLDILSQILKSRSAPSTDTSFSYQLYAATVCVTLPKGTTTEDLLLDSVLSRLSQLRSRSIKDLVLQVKWYPPQSIPERIWRFCLKATTRVSLEASEDCFCLSCRTLRRKRIRRLQRKAILLQL